MGELYQGCLKNQDLNEGLEELRKVRKELKNFSPSDVIWDAEDLSLTPPWGNNISSDITDLSNYFVTSDKSENAVVCKLYSTGSYDKIIIVGQKRNKYVR